MSRVAMFAGIVVFLLASSCVKRQTYLAAKADNRACRGELASAKTEAKEVRGELRAMAHRVGERDARLSGRDQKLQSMAQQVGAFKTCSTKLSPLIEMGSLSVDFRNGQVIINLPSDLLFPIGTTALTNGGMAALAEIVKVLSAYKDRRYIVAGHTDSQPVAAGGSFASNWELSQKRAFNVVEYMIDKGFESTSLAAAGYGDRDPIASNYTAAGRARNRRIEIILVPDLTKDLLPDQLAQEKGAAGAGAECPATEPGTLIL